MLGRGRGVQCLWQKGHRVYNTLSIRIKEGKDAAKQKCNGKEKCERGMKRIYQLQSNQKKGHCSQGKRVRPVSLQVYFRALVPYIFSFSLRHRRLPTFQTSKKGHTKILNGYRPVTLTCDKDPERPLQRHLQLSS